MTADGSGCSAIVDLLPELQWLGSALLVYVRAPIKSWVWRLKLDVSLKLIDLHVKSRKTELRRAVAASLCHLQAHWGEFLRCKQLCLLIFVENKQLSWASWGYDAQRLEGLIDVCEAISALLKKSGYFHLIFHRRGGFPLALLTPADKMSNTFRAGVSWKDAHFRDRLQCSLLRSLLSSLFHPSDILVKLFESQTRGSGNPLASGWHKIGHPLQSFLCNPFTSIWQEKCSTLLVIGNEIRRLEVIKILNYFVKNRTKILE